MISYDFITKSTWNHWALDGVLPALSFTYQYNGILCSLAVLSAFPLTPSSCYAASACLPRRVSHSHLYDMAKVRHDGVDGKEQTRDIPKLICNSRFVFPDIKELKDTDLLRSSQALSTSCTAQDASPSGSSWAWTRCRKIDKMGCVARCIGGMGLAHLGLGFKNKPGRSWMPGSKPRRTQRLPTVFMSLKKLSKAKEQDTGESLEKTWRKHGESMAKAVKKSCALELSLAFSCIQPSRRIGWGIHWMPWMLRSRLCRGSPSYYRDYRGHIMIHRPKLERSKSWLAHL